MSLAWRAIRARPRLLTSAVAAVAGYLMLPIPTPLSRGLAAWDIACLLFLVLCAIKFARTDTSRMADDAERQEEGEWTIFGLTVAGLTASFIAIVGEFSGSIESHRLLRVSLVAATLFLTWLTTQTVFALRYAHEYYETGDAGGPLRGGLQFPGDRSPDYWDFLYFSLVLGMTFQVSDVQITDHRLRRLAALHGFLGFVFNTVIVALTVNLGASLLQPSGGGGG